MDTRANILNRIPKKKFYIPTLNLRRRKCKGLIVSNRLNGWPRERITCIDQEKEKKEYEERMRQRKFLEQRLLEQKKTKKTDWAKTKTFKDYLEEQKPINKFLLQQNYQYKYCIFEYNTEQKKWVKEYDSKLN